MITDEQNVPPESNNSNATGRTRDTQNDSAAESSEQINEFYDRQILSAEHTDDEITNNDGSVIETLDTDFHDEPGFIAGHSLAGSNRADYYEKRSQGKSDAEEEQEYMRNRQMEE
jgi:hypothetical protein